MAQVSRQLWLRCFSECPEKLSFTARLIISENTLGLIISLLFLFKKFYLFICLHQVSVAAGEIFTLFCGMWDLVPWPGIEPGPSASRMQNISHWATREVLCIFLAHIKKIFFLLVFILYRSIVDLQCGVNICSTAKWHIYIHTYILFKYSFPLQFVPGHWI